MVNAENPFVLTFKESKMITYLIAFTEINSNRSWLIALYKLYVPLRHGKFRVTERKVVVHMRFEKLVYNNLYLVNN